MVTPPMIFNTSMGLTMVSLATINHADMFKIFSP